MKYLLFGLLILGITIKYSESLQCYLCKPECTYQDARIHDITLADIPKNRKAVCVADYDISKGNNTYKKAVRRWELIRPSEDQAECEAGKKCVSCMTDLCNKEEDLNDKDGASLNRINFLLLSASISVFILFQNVMYLSSFMS